MPQKEVTATKSLSRFVEHFDMMPPTELLDMIGEEEQQQQQLSTSANNNEKSKKPTPLFALPGFNRHDTGNSLNGAVHPLQNTPSSPISPTRKSYLDRHDSSSPITPLESSPMSSAIQSSSSSPLSAHVGHAETVSNKTNGTVVPTTNSELPTTKSNSNARATSIINTIATNSNLSNIAQQQHKQSQQDQLFSPPPSSTRKKLSSKSSLNRAEFIIRRYESWNRFISLFIAWVNEIAKQSIQAEKAYQASLKESKFSFRRGGGDHHSTKNNGMHGFTADLALEEQKVGRHLQTDQIPNLEKFKKECTSIIKSLKSRPELNQEEFWRRAEITASLISQLNKTCIEARRTIEKGSPVVNDPWLVNLYVLRQLRGEVSEENRLRSLLVPIQQSIRDFEDRLFKAVEDTLKVCLEKPVTLSDDQLSKIQSSLNQVITNNWDTFAAMNKKDIVNEENPLKHYLKINYNCKNDPLVMTVHKGQLERRTGVLNSKYTQRFFVVTKSGFLHQFKLNDKVSPEFSLYLSKCTIVPCMDISDLNRFAQQQDLQEGKISKDGYTFEVQRSGSVLQRDKSYAFRANNFEDMAVWCQHISEVATQSPEATLRPVFVAGMQSTGALASSNSTTTSVEQYQEPDRRPESPPQPKKVVKSGGGSIRLSIDSYHLPQEGSKSQPLSPEVEINKRPDVPVHQAQLQESTPPPSPIKNEEQNYSTEGITFEERRVSEDSSGSFHSFIYETVERPKLYAHLREYLCEFQIYTILTTATGFSFEPALAEKFSSEPNDWRKYYIQKNKSISDDDTALMDQADTEYANAQKHLETFQQDGNVEVLVQVASKMLWILDVFPGHAGCYYILGFILFVLNKLEEAVILLQMGRAVDPTFEPIDVLEEEIERIANGYKGEEELLTADNQLSTALHDVLVEVFNKFDTDKDGALNAKELGSFIFKTNGQHPPPAFLRQMGLRFGANKKGWLSQEGFLAFYLEQTLDDPSETRNDLGVHGYDPQSLKQKMEE